MPYISRAERERARWCTLPEAVAHVCELMVSIEKRRDSNYETHLRWCARGAAMGRCASRTVVDGAKVPLDMPPGGDLMESVDIGWKPGRRDRCGEADRRRLRLLIHWLKACRSAEHFQIRSLRSAMGVS